MEKRITGHTELLGLVATPIRHSKSPVMHNAACRALENVEKINSQTQCKAQLFDLNDHETLRKEINESVIFTNATNVGMGKLEGKMVLPDTSYLRKDLIVSDVIYMPEKTKLLEEAEKIGCKTINGLGMMLYQGAASFKLWTDQDMPIDVVKEALDF